MANLRFEHFKDFFALQSTLEKQKSPNKKGDTLSKSIKKLGFNSPSLLSMIAKGQRLPSNALLEALLDKWDIPHGERESIRLQVEIERRMKKDREVLPLLDRLKKIHGTNQFQELDMSVFEVIRNWYVYVLKELIESPDFSEDPNLIAKRLRGKVTANQIKSAMESLLKSGLVNRDPVTLKLKSTSKDTETVDNISSEAIKEFHKSMIERAYESVSEQSVSERYINALTMRVDPDKFSEVSEKILEFMKKMNELYQAENSDRVYQLNVQFFEHTKDDKKGADRV